MRFAWQSNAPWAGSGYGQQTKLMLPALRELGHDPVCFAFYGLSGGKIEYDGYEVLPNSDYEPWLNDAVQSHIERSEAEVIITLMDLFVLKPEVWRKLSVPWAAWMPIDNEGFLDNVGQTVDVFKHVDFPVAMSNFGADAMRVAGREPAAVIYHAVDTEAFKPMDKDECRDTFGLDKTAYVVGMVMANKGDRKQYPAHFAAIKRWWDEHHKGDNIKLFIHTEPTVAMGGWDMRVLAERMDLKGHVWSTNQYDTSVVPFPTEMMAKLYNCFDVLVNCSAGEGFGIPIAEAQACGIPVVTHNVTAMPEITHNGYTVEPAAKALSPMWGYQFFPDQDDFVYKLECAYRMSDKASAERGRRWVVDNCDVPLIAQQWSDLLKFIEEDSKPLAPPKESVKIS